MPCSAGCGSACDTQYLFSSDVLGTHTGHTPRHAKRYDDFVALMPGGKVYGTENGCFAKTFSLDPDFEWGLERILDAVAR